MNQRMKLLSTLFGLLISTSLLSQNVEFDWAYQAGGGGTDRSQGITVDRSGNMILTGYFNYTSDFDPGPGTLNLTTPLGNPDYFVQKVDKSGNLIWVKQIGGDLMEEGVAICTDNQNNIYVVGNYRGTVDFDPGPGTFNLIGDAGSEDMFIHKMDSNGNFIWASRVAGTGSVKTPNAICADDSGNVYIAGNFTKTVQFNPGGVPNASLTSAGIIDAFVLKLDSNGKYVWVRQFGGESNENANGIAIDPNGDICVGGSFGKTVDFDPGPGVVNLTSPTYTDLFIQKLTPNGDLIWVKGIDGTGFEEMGDLKVDASGNLILTGSFTRRLVFGLAGGTQILSSIGLSADIFVLKLSNDGLPIWARVMGGIKDSKGDKVHVDAEANIYVCGHFKDTAEFNLGGRETKLVALLDYDIFFQKLDSSGTLQWAKSLPGMGPDYASGIAADTEGNVYTTGFFWRKIDVDPGSAKYEFTPNTPQSNLQDFFVLKMKECAPVNSIDLVSACNAFTWIDGVTYTESDSSATYVLATSTGCDSIIHLKLTLTKVNGMGTSVNGKTITADNSTGTYKWLDCNAGYQPIPNATSRSFTASGAGSYAVEITDNGCTDTSSCVNITGVGLGSDFGQVKAMVYPNPSKGTYTLLLNENQASMQLRILDLQGRTIYTENLHNTSSAQFELNAAPGLYWLVVESENGRQVLQLKKY